MANGFPQRPFWATAQSLTDPFYFYLLDRAMSENVWKTRDFHLHYQEAVDIFSWIRDLKFKQSERGEKFRRQITSYIDFLVFILRDFVIVYSSRLDRASCFSTSRWWSALRGQGSNSSYHELIVWDIKRISLFHDETRSFHTIDEYSR